MEKATQVIGLLAGECSPIASPLEVIALKKPPANPQLCLVYQEILPRVSRSFYLTLRILPRQLREPIGLAYLLARISDTVADSQVIAKTDRVEWLESFENLLLSQQHPVSEITAPLRIEAHSHAGEKELLRSIQSVVHGYWACDLEDRLHIQEVIQIILRGQKWDLRRFSACSTPAIQSLKEIGELREYTYLVAGCVGAFWTRMCLRHLSGSPAMENQQIEALGVRFGQGLQWVNILRDFRSDLSSGRCYLPEDLWLPTGWRPGGESDTYPKAFVELWRQWVLEALSCLEDGWQYLKALPMHWCRVRLACAWPLLFGVMTLARLTTPPGPHCPPSKIGRWQVYEILFRTLLSMRLPRVWDDLFDQAVLRIRCDLKGSS